MADTLYQQNGTDPKVRHYKITESGKSFRCDKIGEEWVDTELLQPEHLITGDPAYAVYTLSTTTSKSKTKKTKVTKTDE